jgi:hypothetical protein
MESYHRSRFSGISDPLVSKNFSVTTFPQLVVSPYKITSRSQFYPITAQSLTAISIQGFQNRSKDNPNDGNHSMRLAPRKLKSLQFRTRSKVISNTLLGTWRTRPQISVALCSVRGDLLPRRASFDLLPVCSSLFHITYPGRSEAGKYAESVLQWLLLPKIVHRMPLDSSSAYCIIYQVPYLNIVTYPVFA